MEEDSHKRTAVAESGLYCNVLHRVLYPQVHGNGLKKKKKTKKDLLAHPFAAQLQACKSPGDILAILQGKVDELDQSMNADERLSRWLSPTINVLYSFSATIGAGVGLVSAIKSTCLYSRSSPISQVFSPASVIFSGIGVLLQVSVAFGPCVEAILTMTSILGGQRCRIEPRRTHRSLRAHGELLQAP